MFYTGVVNSFADLRTALFNACSANGWTLTSDVLSKGGAFVQVTTSTATSGAPGPGVILRGGTGYSGGVLAGASPIRPRLGIHNYASPALLFPLVYYIHIFENPDEVFLVVKSGVDAFYWLSFGISNVPGLTGIKLWLAANSYYSASGGNGGVSISPTQGGGNSSASGAFMWNNSSLGSVDVFSDTIYVDMDSLTWSNGQSAGTATGRTSNTMLAAAPQLGYSPNGWNSASTLVRIRSYLQRASSKCSLVLEVQNARFLRNDNFAPGEVITLGTDQWVVYPFYVKNSVDRDGGGNSTRQHSGTLAWAIRYDGP